jgi:hypothetical protein
MLELKVGRLLELLERLTIDRGLFERAHHELTVAGNGHLPFESHEFARLRSAVAEIEAIAGTLNLTTTRVAANRTRQMLEAVGHRPGGTLIAERDHCATVFRHLLEIVSRLRDDCAARIYFQIGPDDARFLDANADHFGPEVSKVFGNAVEDIAEAASCLALERATACVFHLMRALEAAAAVIANKLGAAIVDQHGRGLPWGVIAANMKAMIDKMPKGSDEQTKWYKVQSSLETVGRAWRNPTAHPKQTYTVNEARNVYASTKAFMQELASLS